MTIANHVRSTRAALLSKVATMIIEATPPRDNRNATIDEKDFADMVAATLAAGVRVSKVASRCAKDIKTINGWAKGTETPSPLLRKLLAPQLARLCMASAAELRMDTQSDANDDAAVAAALCEAA